MGSGGGASRTSAKGVAEGIRARKAQADLDAARDLVVKQELEEQAVLDKEVQKVVNGETLAAQRNRRLASGRQAVFGQSQAGAFAPTATTPSPNRKTLTGY